MDTTYDRFLFELCRAAWLVARFAKYRSRRPERDTRANRKRWYWERGGSAAEAALFRSEWGVRTNELAREARALKAYRIDHVVTMENGEPCTPYHSVLRVFAETDLEAFEEGRRLDPRLSPGAEVVLLRDAPVPFDLAAHDVLTALGYRWERVPESWEDDGDAESGPHLTGGPAYDLYEDADSHVIISEPGYWGAAYEVRDLEMEKYAEAMGAECDAYSR